MNERSELLILVLEPAEFYSLYRSTICSHPAK